LPVPDSKSLKQNVLNRLEENYALESLAKEKGVVVSGADIEADYKTISDENNGEENLKKLLKDYYNWTPEIFKNRVIYYSLLGEKLTEAMGGEDKLSAGLENRISDEKVRKYISF
jgi:hypothetical protein